MLPAQCSSPIPNPSYSNNMWLPLLIALISTIIPPSRHQHAPPCIHNPPYSLKRPLTYPTSFYGQLDTPNQD